MKATVVLLLIIGVQISAAGQSKKKISINTEMRDTSAWGKYVREDCNEAGLPNLVKTKDSLHFRYSTDTQSLDIWSNDYKVFHGSLANFTWGNTYKREKKNLPREYYYRVDPLDTAKARKIYTLFDSLRIFHLRPQDSIPEWKLGLDGMDYVIEYSTPAYYSYKPYWSPDAEKDLKEAIVMDTLISKIDSSFNTWQTFLGFIECLPAGMYSCNGIGVLSTDHKQKGDNTKYKKKAVDK